MLPIARDAVLVYSAPSTPPESIHRDDTSPYMLLDPHREKPDVHVDTSSRAGAMCG